jgi:acetyl esterase/lipase
MTEGIAHPPMTSVRAACSVVLTGILVGCGAQTVSLPPVDSSAASPSAAAVQPSASTAVRLRPPRAGAFPPSDVVGMRTEVEIPFTKDVDCGNGICAVPLDVVAPEGAAGLPTIVLLQGGPVPFHERRNGPMIYALVKRGAVVFVPAYRNPTTGTFRDEASFDDVRCAVSYAREHTAEFGGNPEIVVVVGQSHGSWLGLQVAIEPPKQLESCVASASTIPDAVVGLAGFRLQIGEPKGTPPPMWLVGGGADHFQSLHGRDDLERLQELGYDASYQELEGVTHHDMFVPEATPKVIDIVFEAIESLDE